METFAYGRMFPHRGHDLSFHRFVPTNWALSQGLLQLLFLKSRKMIHPHVVLCVCVCSKGFALWLGILSLEALMRCTVHQDPQL